MKNRIYYFTGTGNSLKVAKDIAACLSECEIIPIKRGMEKTIPTDCERIGFVFPVYYWGLPEIVVNLLKDIHFPEQGNIYIFAVATCGGFPGVAIPQTRDILKEKGIQLNYGTGIKMFANAVFNYNMNKRIEKITHKSNERIKALIPNIVEKKGSRIKSVNKWMLGMYLKNISSIHAFDKNFNVSKDCTSCGLCRDICLADNITVKNRSIEFNHQCEACLACIHHCPNKAINYLTKTQDRRRYTHPEINSKELISRKQY